MSTTSIATEGKRNERWEPAETLPHKLEEPLHWRKPRRVFVNSMSDLFHEDVPFDFIAEVFGVMAVAGQTFACGKEVALKREKPYRHTLIKLASDARYGPHTFQILTKRPERMAQILNSPAFRSAVARHAYRWAHNRTDAGYLKHQIDTLEEYGRCYEPGRMWPGSNVWLGTSVEDQERADERIPHLLRCPAAVRFLSCEPLLGPVALTRIGKYLDENLSCLEDIVGFVERPRIDWVIAGGESGPGARPCDVAWIRSLVAQCREAGVPMFCKQLGADPCEAIEGTEDTRGVNAPFMGSGWSHWTLRDRKGGKSDEWPEDLRVREFPVARSAAPSATGART